MKQTIVYLLLLSGTLFAQSKPDVVLDERNHIYWQDNTESAQSSEDWEDALSYCHTLTLDGLQGWRLPTFRELLSIVDFGRVNPAVLRVFAHTAEGTYWTSTPFAANVSRAWTIDFRSGVTYYSYKSTNHAMRCVKDVLEKTEKAPK